MAGAARSRPSASTGSGPRVEVLGIRHHGPGSARAVATALDELAPATVLIEGAPELDAVAALAASAEMVPPVAGLVYVPDEPRRASFWPFAVFSPEWVALRWALAADVPVRFIDLPAANQLAVDSLADESLADDPADDVGVGDGEPAAGVPEAVPHDHHTGDGPAGDADGAGDGAEAVVLDPIGTLAAAAGYDDAERWWEDVVEHRRGGRALFGDVLEAMVELREIVEGQGSEDQGPELGGWRLELARRESAMRLRLRAAIKELADRPDATIAVVCGAWHAPALVPERFPAAAADRAVLKGLPKTKVVATWVPWSSPRLARASGYGAGIAAPGWYEHLFTADDDVTERWMVRTAGLLRDEQIDAPPAGVLEAVRLADALAAVRRRPAVGVDELVDATRAVLCGGDDLPLRLVGERLLVGSSLGSVPADTPMVPLARDLAAQQKRLRLKVSVESSSVDLDLRTPSHRSRSQLFWRLRLLGIDWAVPAATGRTLGTFRESWTLQWQPEMAVAVVEASAAGPTVEVAASTSALTSAREAPSLRTVAEVVERLLRADLPDAVAEAMAILARRAARQHDVIALTEAVEPLARVSRYGDVRRSDTEAVALVLEGLLARIAIGIAAACTGIDDETAVEVVGRIDATQRAVTLVDDPATTGRWQAALVALGERDGVAPLVAGRAVRLCGDAGRLDPADVRDRLWRALSVGADPLRSAAWLEGFLAGDVQLLLHDADLLGVIDGWLAEVPADTFDDVLPLLRRTFARFDSAERRALGRHVRRRSRHASAAGAAASSPGSAGRGTGRGPGRGAAGPDGLGPDPADEVPLDPARATAGLDGVLRLVGVAVARPEGAP